MKTNGKSRKSSTGKRTFEDDFKMGLREIGKGSDSFDKFNDRAQKESLRQINTGGARKGLNADNCTFRDLLGY